MKVVTIKLKSKDEDCCFSEELDIISEQLAEGFESGFDIHSLNSYTFSIDYTHS